ncbi:MAG: hypothetical protein K8R68_08005 [Bacteroidales bacterium]|nr:hypothetical protein [Bacteroidales bacterium]
MRNIAVEEIEKLLPVISKTEGEECNYSYNGFNSIELSNITDISFFTGIDDRDLIKLEMSNAGLIICKKEIVNKFKNRINLKRKILLSVENPRKEFVSCYNHFYIPDIKPGIHPTAIIHNDISFPNDVHIGPWVEIAEGVEIGNNTIIESKVNIGKGIIIGNNVYIQSGAVIGCKGQGFERDDNGVFIEFPQAGIIEIGDHVEIGANSTIVRGTFGKTKIGNGSKIGHLTDIGHNVQIGKNVFISAGVVVCGSAVIKDYAWLGPKCCIRNKIYIGENATIGLGAVVVKNIPDGQLVVGNPAVQLKNRRK